MRVNQKLLCAITEYRWEADPQTCAYYDDLSEPVRTLLDERWQALRAARNAEARLVALLRESA